MDEYFYDGGGVLVLYSVKKYDENKSMWIDYNARSLNGENRKSYFVYFNISGIKDIYMLPERYAEKLFLDDVLQIFIDPHYTPITGIFCNWQNGDDERYKRDHSPDCDVKLHEALVFLCTNAYMNMNKLEKEKLKISDQKYHEYFNYLRYWLLKHGAKIP